MTATPGKYIYIYIYTTGYGTTAVKGYVLSQQVIYCKVNLPVVQSGSLVPLGQKLQPCNSVQTAPGGHTVLAQSGKVPSR